METPEASGKAPKWVLQNLKEFATYGLVFRLYGHPGLLSIAAAINGPDFVPYNEVTFIKEPGLGRQWLGIKTDLLIGIRLIGIRVPTVLILWPSFIQALQVMRFGFCQGAPRWANLI
ncbi:MAG: hypothetical protein CM1200mP4_2780 [Rhodospirillaceae bacterium]|nr:MAG: hypothetical protein CM1200mP4_2780 [Rhodospirillaceae bacterium]